MRPLVSIIIPVYNGAEYLAEAIDSALAQTYFPIEILVVNDGSCDDGRTEQVMRRYGDRIHALSKANGGVSSALNAGIAHMRGDYFSWLSHDDVYLPGKIEAQMAAVEGREHVIALCSGSLMDQAGHAMWHPMKRLHGELDGANLFRRFIRGCTLNGLGFLIPKKAFDEVGLFDESLRYLQDLDMWLRLMRTSYTFVCQPRLLVKTRVHRGQVSNVCADLYEVERVQLAQKLVREVSHLGRRECVCWLRRYWRLMVCDGNRKGERLCRQGLFERGAFPLYAPPVWIAEQIRGLARQFVRRWYNGYLRLRHQRS